MSAWRHPHFHCPPSLYLISPQSLPISRRTELELNLDFDVSPARALKFPLHRTTHPVTETLVQLNIGNLVAKQSDLLKLATSLRNVMQVDFELRVQAKDVTTPVLESYVIPVDIPVDMRDSISLFRTHICIQRVIQVIRGGDPDVRAEWKEVCLGVELATHLQNREGGVAVTKVPGARDRVGDYLYFAVYIVAVEVCAITNFYNLAAEDVGVDGIADLGWQAEERRSSLIDEGAGVR
jgi:hypothetical protein